MKLALTLPGTSIPGSNNIIDSPVKEKFTDLAGVLTGILNIVFYAAAFIAFFFLIWGALAYIMAQGQKENLAKARARITWAIIGLVVTILAFAVAKFASEIFKPTTGGLPF